MIEILNKFYKLQVDQYEEYNEGIIFFVDGTYYYFVKTSFDEDFLNELFNISSMIRNTGIMLHDFVYNKDNHLLSESYVLLRINTFIENIELNDIVMFNSLIFNEYKEEYVSMDKFWENKIDYIEHQLTELSYNKLINNSFDYFVGIAEMLISFYKDNYNNGDSDLYLVHRTITSLNNIDFYNPLNITFGYKYKDIACYIRYTDDWELLDNILDSISINDKVYLFVRMCFPFEYFRLINNIIIENDESKELAILLNNIDKYEEYLGRLQKLFSIYLFYWIKKE